MSMISLNGTLINCFKTPAKAEIGEKDKIQILGDVMLPNGSLKKDLITITVPDASEYEDRQGKEISVGVGVFAPQKGTVIFFIQKS